jgi:hypothetical protein
MINPHAGVNTKGATKKIQKILVPEKFDEIVAAA